MANNETMNDTAMYTKDELLDMDKKDLVKMILDMQKKIEDEM